MLQHKTGSQTNRLAWDDRLWALVARVGLGKTESHLPPGMENLLSEHRLEGMVERNQTAGVQDGNAEEPADGQAHSTAEFAVPAEIACEQWMGNAMTVLSEPCAPHLETSLPEAVEAAAYGEIRDHREELLDGRTRTSEEADVLFR